MMGDARYDPVYLRVAHAYDRAAILREMTDVEVVRALAAASRARDPLLANVLATEAENRMRRAGIAAARAPECILTLDADGRLTYANDAALRLLGCRRDELVGSVIWQAIAAYDEQGRKLAPHERPSHAALYEGRDARGVLDVQCLGRPRVRCIYIAAPIASEAGIEGAVVVFHPA